MKPFKIIALSGVSRSGKDSFYKFASNFLENQGISSGRWAFADELKKDLDDFITEKFGFSSFTEIIEEKNKIRPLLVEYGKIRRNESKGQYWIDKIKETILLPHGPQVRFISDLRFSQFRGGDEVDFVKKQGGRVIHIEKYNSTQGDQKFDILEPANDEERMNDPKIKAVADFKFKWNHFTNCTNGESVGRSAVEDCMRQLKKFWQIETDS